MVLVILFFVSFLVCCTRATTRENLSSEVCELHSRRPACASEQSDQRLCYSLFRKYHISCDIRFPTMWYVRPAKAQAHMHSLIRAFASRLNMLLTEQHLEFLGLKGGCTGSSESTLVKMTHCWKPHVTAHM